jgi:hypothetical protein
LSPQALVRGLPASNILRVPDFAGARSVSEVEGFP